MDPYLRANEFSPDALTRLRAALSGADVRLLAGGLEAELPAPLADALVDAVEALAEGRSGVLMFTEALPLPDAALAAGITEERLAALIAERKVNEIPSAASPGGAVVPLSDLEDWLAGDQSGA